MEQGDVRVAGQPIQKNSSATLVSEQGCPNSHQLTWSRSLHSGHPLHQQMPWVTSLAWILLRASGLAVPVCSHSGNALFASFRTRKICK